jgi:hypothetical protein
VRRSTLSTRLERYLRTAIVVVAALLAGGLVALPAEAQAQQADNDAFSGHVPQSSYEGLDPVAEHRVVEPGDSLWAIAQEHLGPYASPQQVATEVERTHWLNRDRIGEDPNLLLVGQQLSLAPASGSPGHAPQTKPVVAPGPAVVLEDQPAAEEQPATGEQPTVVGQTPGQKGEPAPETATPEPAQEERAVESPTSATTKVEPSPSDPPYDVTQKPDTLRLLLAAGFFLFSAAVGALGIWKILTTRKLLRERLGPAARHDEPRGPDRKAAPTEPERALGAPADRSPANGSDADRLATVLALGGRRKRRLRAAGSGQKEVLRRSASGTKRLLLHEPCTSDAYSPQVRRSLRRAQRLRPPRRRRRRRRRRSVALRSYSGFAT